MTTRLAARLKSSAPHASVVVVLAVLLALVPTPSMPAAWPSTGFSPASWGSPLQFEVRSRGDVASDVTAFARVAERTFNDRRGWTLGGTLRYYQVPSGGHFTLWLASPSDVHEFSAQNPECTAQDSCMVGRNVIVNEQQWLNGAGTWPDLREYRAHLLNHVLGHWLGLAHSTCPRPGSLAPVMMHQSASLGGCARNTWPLEPERHAVARPRRLAVNTQRPEVYAVLQQGSAGTEVHALNPGVVYETFSQHAATVLGATDPTQWTFEVADLDGGSVDDLVGIRYSGGSGRTEVHVLSGGDMNPRDGRVTRRYGYWLLQAATALPPTSPETWSFDTGDTNGDGHLDLVAVEHAGESGRTEVHVLDGATGYRSLLDHVVTPLHRTHPDEWSMGVGDHDRDGWPDLYAIDRRGGSGRVEVHVLDGEGGFEQWLHHGATPLHPVYDEWELLVEDVQGDGYASVMAVDRHGSSGRTEVHVLEHKSYDRWYLNAATALHPTTNPAWRFSAD